MNRINKYIKVIILFSSIALLGFLLIQFYWVKNTYNEKKKNIDQVLELCVDKIGDEIECILLKKATTHNTSISSNLTDLHDLTKNKKRFVDSIDIVLNNDNKQSLLEKRRKIMSLIQICFPINLTLGIEQLLTNDEILKIINNVLTENKITSSFHYSITEETGVLLFTNMKGEINSILKNSSIYEVNVLTEETFMRPVKFSLYIPNIKSNIISSILHIFILSILLIIIVIGSFIYIIKIIKTQKKNSQIKTDFINNMTHELKTPIATIGLACEALNDTNLSSDKIDKNKFLKTISNENERLGKLVENVLQNAVSEKDKPELKLEIFNLENVIEKAIKNIQISFQQKQGFINTDFLAVNKLVEADKLHITNVIYNLLDNSLKYSNENPQVLISTKDIIGGIVIKIKDNGIGIAKENHNRIFEKLYRVPTGDLHNIKGFGLGLSYVKSIIDLHGGTIKVESKIDNGSTFIVSLKSSKIIKS